MNNLITALLELDVNEINTESVIDTIKKSKQDDVIELLNLMVCLENLDESIVDTLWKVGQEE